MLLTSSQVSVLFSTAIIISFTSALFLAGYILQQQTLRGLQAEIKPRVARIHAAATASSSSRALNSPTSPVVVSHATPTTPALQHEVLVAGVSAAQGAQPHVLVDAGRSAGLSGGGIGVDGSKGSEWKSREKSYEEALWTKGRERFEAEGDDFFRAVKGPQQAVGGRKDGRRSLWGK